MALGLSFGVSTDTQAASSVKVIDGSKLTTDAESIGYNQKVARGEDLLTGYSKIVREWAQEKSMPEAQHWQNVIVDRVGNKCYH